MTPATTLQEDECLLVAAFKDFMKKTGSQSGWHDHLIPAFPREATQATGDDSNRTLIRAGNAVLTWISRNQNALQDLS